MILLEDVPKLVDELLQPIPGDNPSGKDLRYDPVYDAIRESRREDDDLAQGAWQTERKVADLPKTISLSTDALKKKTKDLQIAAWLTDAVLRKDGFGGLVMGLKVFYGLIDKFWDTVYPLIDEDDLELRAAPLNLKFEIPVRQSPLNREGHTWYQYNESRAVGYEDQAKEAAQKKKREALLAEKKLAPEIFDKSFRETPKAFYAGTEKAIDEALSALEVLTTLCDEKFGDSSPSFGKLKTALQEVRHVVHGLLDKKRETEPDPVAEVPVEPEAEAAAGGAGEGGEQALTVAGARPQAAFAFTVTSSESPARRELVGRVDAVAAALLQR